jgi:hypothetical protein
MTEEELIEAARHIPNASDRAVYLDRACASNPALRQRVEAQLRSADPDSVAREQIAPKETASTQVHHGFLRWRVPLRAPSIGKVMAGVSLLGLVGLSFLFGASVMFFQLPPSDFLNEAFSGAKALHERGHAAHPSRIGNGAMGPGRVTVYKAGKTYDGFTLYTATDKAQATLIDMHGEVVHQWELPFDQAWKNPPHVHNAVSDQNIHWFRCHLYPNGDLLAIYHTDVDTPYGYGLVKLDKDSRLLWAYAGRVHHDIDVAEDGKLYTLTQRLETKPPPGMEYIPCPYIADALTVLSPDGHELESIPLLDAFRGSSYELTLRLMIEGMTPVTIQPAPGITPPPVITTTSDSSTQLNWKGDFIHANSVKILGRNWAPKFPLFETGQVLLSLRNLDSLVVVDMRKRSVVWAARGLWRIQHDAEFLANGHLLLFDNSGSVKGCRVLEYDPLTQAIPWAYPNENSIAFTALFRGMKQRLPNSNTLIVDPDNGRIFEVTLDKELVWESYCPRVVTALTSARRYHPDELPFLKGASRAQR